MYLVLSAFTSTPNSLLATTTASVFSSQYVRFRPIYYHQHKTDADVYRLISSHLSLPELS